MHKKTLFAFFVVVVGWSTNIGAKPQPSLPVVATISQHARSSDHTDIATAIARDTYVFDNALLSNSTGRSTIGMKPQPGIIELHVYRDAHLESVEHGTPFADASLFFWNGAPLPCPAEQRTIEDATSGATAQHQQDRRQTPNIVSALYGSDFADATPSAYVVATSPLISPVPEIQSWTMLIAGLGALGLISNRRKTSLTVRSTR